MLRRTLISIASGALLLGLTVPSALAGNPSGTGQPSASCGSAGAEMMPAGFNTSGFTNAAARYAGSDGTPSLANAQSSAAVSQYDVACYQITQHH